MNRYYADFRDNLINTINNSNLELGAVYYILKDVTNLVYEKFLEGAQAERESEERRIQQMQEAAMNATEAPSEDPPEEDEDV